jgi:hypothetical protein
MTLLAPLPLYLYNLHALLVLDLRNFLISLSQFHFHLFHLLLVFLYQLHPLLNQLFLHLRILLLSRLASLSL